MSKECKDEVMKDMNRMAQDFRLNWRLNHACEGEIEKLCPNTCSTQPGAQMPCGGLMLQCLQDKQDNITSQACQDEVFYYELMEVTDFRNDVILAEACRNDVEAYCKDVEPGVCARGCVWGRGGAAKARLWRAHASTSRLQQHGTPQDCLRGGCMGIHWSNCCSGHYPCMVPLGPAKEIKTTVQSSDTVAKVAWVRAFKCAIEQPGCVKQPGNWHVASQLVPHTSCAKRWSTHPRSKHGIGSLSPAQPRGHSHACIHPSGNMASTISALGATTATWPHSLPPRRGGARAPVPAVQQG